METKKLLFRENSDNSYLSAIFSFVMISVLICAFISLWVNPLISAPICIIIFVAIIYKRRNKIYFLSFYEEGIVKEFTLIKKEERIPYKIVQEVIEINRTKHHFIQIIIQGIDKPLGIYYHEEIMRIIKAKGKEYKFPVQVT